MGLRRLYLKVEGATPTGNHKYHLARTACAVFPRSGKAGIAVASCGHLGYSLAVLCARWRIPCRAFLVRGSPFDFAQLGLEAETYETYELAVEACAAWSGEQGWLDATPGAELATEYLNTYASAAYELIADLGQSPAVVICPAGNGTTISGIHQGFRQVINGHMPRHYAATTGDNRFVSESPLAVEDWVTEPLRSARPLDAETAARALAASGGRFVRVSRQDLLRASHWLNHDHSLNCHPASAAAVAALGDLRATGEVLADDLVVAVVTTQERG